MLPRDPPRRVEGPPLPREEFAEPARHGRRNVPRPQRITAVGRDGIEIIQHEEAWRAGGSGGGGAAYGGGDGAHGMAEKGAAGEPFRRNARERRSALPGVAAPCPRSAELEGQSRDKRRPPRAGLSRHLRRAGKERLPK